jgi:hypothetical protein
VTPTDLHSTKWSTTVSNLPNVESACHRPRGSIELITYGTEPTDQYITNFSWNKIRYRADKSLGELIDTLGKVMNTQYSYDRGLFS